MSTDPTALPSEPTGLALTPTPADDSSQLAARLTALETRFPATSWLYGGNFIKRALAMWGHVIVIQIIIGIVVWAIFFVCFGMFGGMLAAFGNR